MSGRELRRSAQEISDDRVLAHGISEMRLGAAAEAPTRGYVASKPKVQE